MSVETNSIVRNHAIMAGAAAWIPVPVADMTAIALVQTDMLRALNAQHDKKWSTAAMKQLLLLTGTAMAGKGTFATLIKFIPGAGTLIGGSLQFVVATAFTWALGKAYDLHLSSGGEPAEMDAEKFYGTVKKFYDEGKKFAKDNKDEIKQKGRSA